MNILKCFWREGSEQQPLSNLVTADDTIEIHAAFVSQSEFSSKMTSETLAIVCRAEKSQTNRFVIYLFVLSQRLGLWDLQEMSFRLT